MDLVLQGLVFAVPDCSTRPTVHRVLRQPQHFDMLDDTESECSIGCLASGLAGRGIDAHGSDVGLPWGATCQDDASEVARVPARLDDGLGTVDGGSVVRMLF